MIPEPKVLSTHVLVLHVRKGYEARERFMRRQLEDMGIEFSFFTEGDMEDLTPEILDRYFTGEMHCVSPVTSCALKHLKAYEHLVENPSLYPGVLILEDDIILGRKFPQFYNKCLQEASKEGYSPMLVSFEDTSLQYVRGSERRRGRHLYRASRDRYAGCYFISTKVARQILEYVAKHKCHLPIDRFHTYLIEHNNLPYYWSHPTKATQGSKNGRFASSLSLRDKSRIAYLRWSYPIKRAYKKLFYLFR